MPNDGQGKSPGEGFTLTTLPGRKEISRAQWEAWAKMFGKSERQIRRWVQKGEAADDPCPLDNLSAFPDWWARNQTWKLPTEIAALVQAASGEQTGKAAPDVPAVDLAALDLGDGEAVLQARKLVQAAWSEVERAYANRLQVDAPLARHTKAVETLRKQEKDALEAAKRRGDWIPRTVIERDVATALNLLKQMRESMERKVLELLPGVTPELKGRIAQAVRQVREKEDYVFRNLRKVKSEEDVAELLAA